MLRIATPWSAESTAGERLAYPKASFLGASIFSTAVSRVPKLNLLVLRELCRRSVALLAVSVLTIEIALAYFVRGPYAEIAVIANHFLLPLVLAPTAAFLVARDRDRGFADILPSLGVNRALSLGSKLLALLVVAAVFQMLALIADAIALWDVNIASFGRVLLIAGVGMGASLATGMLGLIVGYASRGSTVAIASGVAVAFLLAGASYVPSIPGIPSAARPIFVLSHLFPTPWAIHLTNGYEHYRLSHVLALIASTVLICGIALALIGIVASQTEAGWWRGDRARVRRAILPLAVAILAFTGAGVAGSLVAPTEAGDNIYRRPYYHEGLKVGAEGSLDLSTHEGFIIARLESLSPLNLSFSNAALVSEDVTFAQASFPENASSIATARAFVTQFKVQFTGKVHTFDDVPRAALQGIHPLEGLRIGVHLDPTGDEGIPGLVWPIFVLALALAGLGPTALRRWAW